jgi:hypothetical protein
MDPSTKFSAAKKRLHAVIAAVAALPFAAALSAFPADGAAQKGPGDGAAAQKGLAASAAARIGPADGAAAQKGNAAMHAKGPFEVKLVPQADAGDGVARMSLDKQFHGELEATSRGQMLSVMGEVKGSAGYVAMERVTGVLGGKKGTFALQHGGSMDRGVPSLSGTVVPDSGTGELAGLAGRMDIRIEAEGKHFYDFEYTLPETK